MSGLKTERRSTPDGEILLVTLDRPQVLNAIDDALLNALEGAIEQAATDTAVGAMVVTGARERAFSAGADISTFTSLDAVGAEALMRRGQQVFQALEDLPLPVVAAVNGYALGGGLELALACDMRFAANSAKLGQPEATLANLPGWGGTQRLPRAVGEARAKDLIYSGRLVDTSEAERIGLVQRVFSPATLLDETIQYLTRLLPTGRTALGFAKEAVHAARSGGAAGYAVERNGVAVCFTTEAQQRAVQRFVTKDKS